MNYLKFQWNIDVEKNPLDLKIEDYLDVALRNNAKRKFLFISKKLGKHLPVNPNKVNELGQMLAYLYKRENEEYKKEKSVVIGFAETATALSHSFFNYLEGAEAFLHTTREEVNYLEKLEFKEEHSHAVEQGLYIEYLDKFKELDTVILVDDEITTANTCINMIKEFQNRYTAKKYIIASLLNWISVEREEEIRNIGENLGCEIEFIYLFGGSFEFILDHNYKIEDQVEKIKEGLNRDAKINYINLNLEKYILEEKYIKYTGRFGINRDEHEELKKIIKREGKKLKVNDKKSKILALGIEEFMYIPMMLSREIGGDIYYHSITRSPIIPIKNKDYPIRSKYEFKSFYNDNINYLYNLDIQKYDECFLFIELYKDEKRIDDLIKIFKSLGIKVINIVMC